MLSNLRMLYPLSVLTGLLNVGYAQPLTNSSSPLSIAATKVKSAIHIDGLLDERAWQKMSMVDRFIQREPKEGELISERTEVRILYNEDNLYLGFRCWDKEPHRIVANEMRRDMDLVNNDCVEIFLDTYHDHRTAFYFCTNPLGAQRDGMIIGEVSDDEQNWNWNGVWDNASRLDSSGWTAEIAIPFKTLRFHEGEGMVWGMNLVRYIPRKREEAFWSPIWRDYGSYGKYRASAYGHLTGLQNLQQPVKLEWKPYVLAGAQRELAQNLPYERKLDVGGDAKYHLTPNLTADVSVNTDFAQVEADQEQVNLTRFELFFPEKRDFFLEGAGIFRFGERAWSLPANILFFSRRIGLSEDNELVSLSGGVKMTGKVGRFNIGFLNMMAKREHYTIDGLHKTIPKTNFSALRVQKDILANSMIGLIALNKESLDDKGYNRSVGVDATIFVNPKTQVSGFVAKTFSPGASSDDFAAYGDLFFNDDFWTFRLAQSSIQDNFNAEMGFVPRTGIRRSQINFGVSPRPKLLNIRQLTTFNDFNYFVNHRGEFETRFNATGLWIVFQNGATYLARFEQNVERLTDTFEIHENVDIHSGKYHFNNFFSEYESDKSKAVSGKANFTVGNFYDGDIRGFGWGANLKVGARFTMNLEYNHNNVKLSSGRFTTTVIGTRMLYTFSPRLFIKPYIQWNSEKKAVLGNFLVNFIHTPGSDIFLVYNEELSKDGKKVRTQYRALMCKFTYLL